jgi:hypothetical protein
VVFVLDHEKSPLVGLVRHVLTVMCSPRGRWEALRA